VLDEFSNLVVFFNLFSSCQPRRDATASCFNSNVAQDPGGIDSLIAAPEKSRHLRAIVVLSSYQSTTTTCNLKRFLAAMRSNYLPEVQHNPAISHLCRFAIPAFWTHNIAGSAKWKLSLAGSSQQCHLKNALIKKAECSHGYV